MDKLQEIKERYDEAYIEDFGDYEIVHVDKRDLDSLISTVEEQQQRIGALETANDLLHYHTLEQQMEIDELKKQKNFQLREWGKSDGKLIRIQHILEESK